MQIELSIPQLFTIGAIMNGMVFCFLLLEKKQNRKANQYLSLVIFCMCLTFTPYMLEDNIWHQYRWLAWMPFSLGYWIGPAFYFYVRLLTRSVIPTGKDLWHFAPIVLNYVHSIYHGVVGPSNPAPIFHYLSEFLESGAILSIVIYVVISYRLVASYQESLLHHVSNIDLINLQWIKQVIVVLIASFMLILVFLIVSSGLSGKESLSQWQEYKSVILMFYAGTLYWLSISGFKQAQTLIIPDYRHPTNSKKPSDTIKTLENSMTLEKLYRIPDLSLAGLSKSIDLSERTISDALNKEVGKNFYQFVNEYRIAEVQEKLIDPDYYHLKIFSIAQDAGFNSKASFNRVFKMYTGLTPKRYKEAKLAGSAVIET